MNQACVTLSVLVARTDTAFMLHTIPHLVRMCNFPFVERVLVVDTADLNGSFARRPGTGTLGELRRNCAWLVRTGMMDRVIDIDYSEASRRARYVRHFGVDFPETHDFRGSPILGFIFSLEEMPNNYVLHFDSDMMLFQRPGYDWITAGVELMRQSDDVLCVLPQSGPPTEDGSQPGQQEPGPLDARGFYRFKHFTSRLFLVDRRRLQHLLPLRATNTKHRLSGPRASWLTTWEDMVTDRLARSPYVRADLASDVAWSLHPTQRGPHFLSALPYILRRIEEGWYPPEQAGYYDLCLDAYMHASRGDPKMREGGDVA